MDRQPAPSRWSTSDGLIQVRDGLIFSPCRAHRKAIVSPDALSSPKARLGGRVTNVARRIAESPRFQHFILAVILVGAIVIGVETSAALTARYRLFITALELLIQAVFVVEIAIRILAYWPRPLAFFKDGWNVFDFLVVAGSLLPQVGAFTMVARLARLLRVTRLVSVFPELRLIVGTMVRSIPSMGHVIVLLTLLLYVYAVLGFHFFRESDPEHWSSLGAALLTLFQVLTLERLGGGPGRGARGTAVGLGLFQQLRVCRGVRRCQSVHCRRHQQPRVGKARAAARCRPRQRAPRDPRGDRDGPTAARGAGGAASRNIASAWRRGCDVAGSSRRTEAGS